MRAALAALVPAGKASRLSILIYHRVLRAPDPLFPGEVDAQQVDRQLGWIKQMFNVLPLEEATRRLAGDSLPSRPACITFDDGYADNAEIALPILRRHGVPATFFITTGCLDGGRMWNDTIIESLRRAKSDRLDLTKLGLGVYAIESPSQRRAAIDTLIAAHKYLPDVQRAEHVEHIREQVGEPLPNDLMMCASQVRQLHDAGMGIGAHTVTHPILARADATTARREIAEGRETLEAILDERLTLFAYPNGKPGVDYTPDHVAMVKSLGFSAAVATRWGAARRGCDLFQLPRFTPWDRTPARFALRLAHNLLRSSP